MAAYTWSGIGNFTDPSHWDSAPGGGALPGTIPTANDYALVQTGALTINGTVPLKGLNLNENYGATTSVMIVLASATLPNTQELQVIDYQQSPSSPLPILSVTGASTINGATEIGIFAGFILNIGPGSMLTNTGSMSIGNGLIESGGGALVNSGLITINKPASMPVGTTGPRIIADPVSGTGTIVLGQYATLELGNTVGSGQAVAFDYGGDGHAVLQLDRPSGFAGTLIGFSPNDQLNLAVSATSIHYTQTGSGIGTLAVLNGSTTVASVNLVGQYADSEFAISPTTLSGGQAGVQITTGAPNDVLLGGLTNLLGGPVYRFFDTTNGTHLFVSSAYEAQVIHSTRPDLTMEASNFGAFGPGSEGGPEPVYRFFDTVHGTHFYTASASEVAGLTTPGTATYRPDLALEQSATFFESAYSGGSDDVPVHRLFDTVHGTQFLTADPVEYSNVTTPGTVLYRPDLRDEGIAFWAPKLATS